MISCCFTLVLRNGGVRPHDWAYFINTPLISLTKRLSHHAFEKNTLCNWYHIFRAGTFQSGTSILSITKKNFTNQISALNRAIECGILYFNFRCNELIIDIHFVPIEKFNKMIENQIKIQSGSLSRLGPVAAQSNEVCSPRYLSDSIHSLQSIPVCHHPKCFSVCLRHVSRLICPSLLHHYHLVHPSANFSKHDVSSALNIFIFLDFAMSNID